MFEERHATWLELFFDLAFVAAIGQVSTALVEDFSWGGVSKALILFIPIWWAWVGQAYYLSRFDSDDLFHRVTALGQILLVASLAVNVPAAFEGNPRAYALSYAGLRGVLVLQYIVAGIQVKKARRLTTRYSLGFSLAASLWIVSVFLPPGPSVVVWALAILIDFLTPFTCPKLALQIPPDYSHIPERFGLFTIIVLGEAIIAAVTGMRYEGLGEQGLAAGPLGLVIAFALWWYYFDGVKGQQVRIPERTKDVGRLMVWLYAHLPLAAGIVVTAIGIKFAMKTADVPGAMGPMGPILVASVFAAFAGLHTIYWAGLNPKLAKISRRISFPHTLTTAATLLLIPIAGTLRPTLLVLSLAGLAVLHVLWTLRDIPDLEELLERVESAKKQTATQI